jgi:hypothetical protein
LVGYYARGGIKIFEALRWGMIQKRLGNTALDLPVWQFISIFKSLRIRSNRVSAMNSSQAALIRAILGKWKILEKTGEKRHK